MSLWQFQSAVNGYVAANSTDDGQKTTEELVEQLGDLV